VAATGALLAAEGPNEPNNWPVCYQGQCSSSSTSLPVAKFQADIYAAVKADPKLAGIPVFASSEAGGSEPDNVGLQYLVIPKNAGTLMASGTKYADYANTHNYMVGNGMTHIVDNNAWFAESPAVSMGPWDGPPVEYGVTWRKHFQGYSPTQLLTLPKVTTETGWLTSGTGAITQDQQGKLFLNLYLDAFTRGWSYTFVYMLRDDPVQGYWGLFNIDWSPKLSATYLHNLTTILADNTSNFTPGRIDFSIPNQPATVHDVLMQKSNGTFELVVWDEQASGSSTVTVQLGGNYSVDIYDPTVGTSPVESPGTVSSVVLQLSDHPQIIQLN
jgi:hypothetical protein